MGGGTVFVDNIQQLFSGQLYHCQLSRAHATDPAVLNVYYDKLESNNILDKAGSIFNCDESGFSLSPSP